MTVLMTKKKADALKSIERDRYLISDSAARERALDAEPPAVRERLRKMPESRAWLDLRNKVGK